VWLPNRLQVLPHALHSAPQALQRLVKRCQCLPNALQVSPNPFSRLVQPLSSCHTVVDPCRTRWIADNCVGTFSTGVGSRITLWDRRHALLDGFRRSLDEAQRALNGEKLRWMQAIRLCTGFAMPGVITAGLLAKTVDARSDARYKPAVKIAIASDHAGFAYKGRIIEMLEAEGHEVRDFGAFTEDPVDYPLFIAPAAEAVAAGDCERGVVLGGSGNGEQMVANKVRGIRCALCWNTETARLARAHNDANVISIGQRTVPVDLALEIVRTWLGGEFEGGRHTARVQEIASLESRVAAGPTVGYAVHEKTLLIRPEYLNHHGTVFGGYMMKWADDMAFNAASLNFPETEFVTRRFDAFDFANPVRSGDIIKVYARVEKVGTSSCAVAVWCLNAETKATVFRTTAVMVNVGLDGRKAPIPR
jgi:ribose 5-phosphate isomerase B